MIEFWAVRGFCLIIMITFIVCSCYMFYRLAVEVIHLKSPEASHTTRPEAIIHLGTLQALEQAILDAKPIGVEYELSFVVSDAVPPGIVRITVEVRR